MNRVSALYINKIKVADTLSVPPLLLSPGGGEWQRIATR
jgi:hypothetical protein